MGVVWDDGEEVRKNGGDGRPGLSSTGVAERERKW